MRRLFLRESFSARAQTYVWKDAEGKPHVTSEAPPASAAVVRILQPATDCTKIAAAGCGPETTRRFRFFLGELIGQAKSSIVVATYYATDADAPGLDKVVSALAAARKRGVAVSVLLEARPEEPSWSRDVYDRLIDLGVPVRYLKDRRIQHIKTIVVDDEYLFLGSQNLTYSALTGDNWEAGVILRSPAMARAMAADLAGQE